jgi:U3 small nucleolar RNA-associated protein 10
VQAKALTQITDFWQSPTHFTPIAAPLLDRLQSTSATLTRESIIPAITALASAASSSDHQKEMNSRILSLMRADEASTRLAAVKCEQALTERLGEDWLALLPEMLPIITELLEDDDETVELETRRWIKKVEEILGESLDSMLQ